MAVIEAKVVKLKETHKDILSKSKPKRGERLTSLKGAQGEKSASRQRAKNASAASKSSATPNLQARDRQSATPATKAALALKSHANSPSGVVKSPAGAGQGAPHNRGRPAKSPASNVDKASKSQEMDDFTAWLLNKYEQDINRLE